MKRLTISDKKQVKEKEKQKKESNKEKITQRVKININIPTQKAPSSTAQFPTMFNTKPDKEQLNLLASINERLKPQPVKVANEPKEAPPPLIDFNEITNPPLIDFNEITNPPLIDFEKPIVSSIDLMNQPKALSFTDELAQSINKHSKKETDVNKMESDIEALKPKAQSFEGELAQAINKRSKKETDVTKIERDIETIKPKITNTSPLKEELFNKVNQKKEIEMMGNEDINANPLIPPKDNTNLSLLEQVIPLEKKKKKLIIEEDDEDIILEQQLKNEKLKLEEKIKESKEEIEKEIEKEKKKRGRPRLTEEQIRLREEEELNKKEELRKQTELNRIQKELDKKAKIELERVQAEREKQDKKNTTKKLISDKAFNVLLSETPEDEKGRIRRQYEVDDLSDAEIRAILRQRYNYTAEQIKRLFSNK